MGSLVALVLALFGVTSNPAVGDFKVLVGGGIDKIPVPDCVAGPPARTDDHLTLVSAQTMTSACSLYGPPTTYRPSGSRMLWIYRDRPEGIRNFTLEFDRRGRMVDFRSP
jgi:hypothetical protein